MVWDPGANYSRGPDKPAWSGLLNQLCLLSLKFSISDDSGHFGFMQVDQLLAHIAIAAEITSVAECSHAAAEGEHR